MQQNLPKRPAKQGNLMNEVFFKFLPYWPLFIVAVVLSMAGAWFYLRTATPIYEASASIMLKDETKGAQDGATLNSLDRLSDKKIIENELKILLSRSLMLDVVDRLHIYASYFEESELIPQPAYITTPVVLEAADPSSIRSIEKIEYSFNYNDSTVIIGSHKYPINKFVTTDYGLIRFVKNKRFARRPLKKLYFSLTNPRNAAGQLRSTLAAIPGRESTVVSLSIKDVVPERAEDVLNELMAAYDRATIAEKDRIASNTASFVDERLDSVQRELDAINQKKQSYKASKDAVNISSQGELFLNNVSQNDQKVSEVNVQLSALNQIEGYVKSKDNADAVVPSTLGLKEPMLTKMLDDLYDAQTSYEKLKKTSGENNPMVTAIKDRIEKLKPNLLENIANQKKALEASKMDIYASNNVYSSMLHSIPQKERDLIDIDRELTIKLELYNFLRQKKEESALAHASNISGTRVVDKAQAVYTPVSPNSKMIYMVAIVLGLALPTAFVFLKEMLNRKVLFRTEIEKLTSVPIIGEIMLDKSKDPIVIREGQRTFIAEQFRRLRTSLSYLGVNSTRKKILVTSSLSGEGKSFVAANLALSLAVAGKKVILLEFDLANPTLNDKLSLSHEKGVSNYLWGECEPEEVIKRTTIHENLFFIPSGSLPDNPSEMLMSPRLSDLLDTLESIFDNVVIDSAPASLLSDAYVLSPQCDATLYVVKHKYTPKMFLERLDEDSAVTKLKNLGIVFNGIQSRGFTKNGYGYGYGYGYVYNSNYGKKRSKVKK